MNDARKGEIALAMIKNQRKQEGLQLNSMKRQLGNVAKQTGIPLEELMEFERLLAEQLMEETFGKKQE